MNEKKDLMLTTFDNPFNPFDDFVRWWKQDLILGHDCCGLLAREANISTISSEAVNDLDVIAAMKRIVRNEPMIYKIVHLSDYDKAVEVNMVDNAEEV